MSEPSELERFWSALEDRYSPEDVLGRGGMASVYRARDLKHGRDVAIKVLEPELGVTIGAERFHREIAIEASLQHPSILPLFDSGQVGPFLYYVMPLADGGSLAERLARDGPLAVSEAVDVARSVAAGLAHAHARGIIHRDIKPANILFVAGHATLGDFGIARAVSRTDDEQLTDSGISVGTPAYMSPEQASTDSQVDQRSDIYSLGCVLFEMLVGEPPFTGPNARVIFARQIAERPPSVQIARPDVPNGLARTVGRMLSKEAVDRHSDIDAVIEELQGRAESWETRSPTRPVWIGAFVVLSLALAGSWYLVSDRPPLSQDKVAVFPLATRGIGAVDDLDGAGVAYLIEAALEHADPLRLIDVTPRLPEAQLGNPELIGADVARRIATENGAASYMTGVVQRHADSTTVILRLHDAQGDSLLDQSSATGAFGVPLHHLGIDAVLELLPILIQPGSDIDLTGLRDRRPDAVALWWQGERAYRRSDFESALDLYERALARDSALVIAAVKGAQAADWLHADQRGAALVTIALANDPLLPDRYRVLARGLDAFFSGRPDSAMAHLKAAEERYPEWREASAALGEVYAHALPRAAPLDSLAQAAFSRAAANPGFTPPMFHLIERHLRAGETEAADQLLALLRTEGATPSVIAPLELMYECLADPRRMDWDARITEVTSLGVFQAGKTLSAGALQFGCAEGAFRSILGAETTSAGERWGAFLGLQSILIATGRDREAAALIDSVAVRTGRARSLYVLATLAGAEMHGRAAELDVYARERYGEAYEGVVNAESLWVLSHWLRHTEDVEGQRAILEVISARVESETATEEDHFYRRAIVAHQSASVEDPTSLSRLRELPTAGRNRLAWDFGAALAPERLLLARLHLEQGRYVEALAAASVFDHGEPILFVQFVPASLQVRLQAAEALGATDAALRFEQRLRNLQRTDLISSLTPREGGS